MPTLEEAANSFARDLMGMNFAGLMVVFTPEGMMKAMALQGQMLAQAQTSGQVTPGQMPADSMPTSYEVLVEAEEGEDRPVRMGLSGARGTAVFRTVWREVEGVWKVNDMTLVEMTPAEPPPAAAEPAASLSEGQAGAAPAAVPPAIEP